MNNTTVALSLCGPLQIQKHTCTVIWYQMILHANSAARSIDSFQTAGSYVFEWAFASGTETANETLSVPACHAHPKTLQAFLSLEKTSHHAVMLLGWWSLKQLLPRSTALVSNQRWLDLLDLVQNLCKVHMDKGLLRTRLYNVFLSWSLSQQKCSTIQPVFLNVTMFMIEPGIEL